MPQRPEREDIVLAVITIALAATVVKLTGPKISEQQMVENLYNQTPGPEHPLDIQRKAAGPIEYVLKRNRTTWIDEGVRGTEIPVYQVETNSKGLREESFNRSPPANTTRILFIGDSFTYGWGVNESERFTDLFEERLNKEYSKRFQTINAGIPGTGLEDFYLFLRERGAGYHPDYLIVPFQKSDVFSTDDSDRLEKKARKGLPANVSRERLRNRIEELKEKKYLQVSLRETDLTSEILSIRNLARKKDISPIFYIIRPLNQNETDFLREWSLRTGTEIIFPPEKLRQLKSSKYHVTPDDGHYNEYGHRLLYEKLYTEFRDNYIETAERGGRR